MQSQHLSLCNRGNYRPAWTDNSSRLLPFHRCHRLGKRSDLGSFYNKQKWKAVYLYYDCDYYWFYIVCDYSSWVCSAGLPRILMFFPQYFPFAHSAQLLATFPLLQSSWHGCRYCQYACFFSTFLRISEAELKRNKHFLLERTFSNLAYPTKIRQWNNVEFSPLSLSLFPWTRHLILDSQWSGQLLLICDWLNAWPL